MIEQRYAALPWYRELTGHDDIADNLRAMSFSQTSHLSGNFRKGCLGVRFDTLTLTSDSFARVEEPEPIIPRGILVELSPQATFRHTLPFSTTWNVLNLLQHHVTATYINLLGASSRAVESFKVYSHRKKERKRKQIVHKLQIIFLKRAVSLNKELVE